jgi:hypothetical protein
MFGHNENMRNIGLSIFAVVLAAFVSSCSSTARIEIDKYQFSYREPKAKDWSVKQTAYDKFLIINYIKQSIPKKEFSILVEKTAYKDVHLQSTLKEIKRRLPSAALFSESFDWPAVEKNGASMEFHIPSKKPPLYGLVLIAYKNGYMYNIVFSKYGSKPTKDTELVELIETFKIKED